QFGIKFGLFLSVKSNFLGRFQTFALYEIACLYKHTRTATGRVKHNAVVGFYYVYNGLNQTHRRKKLSAFLCTSHCKFVEEVFVNLPEQITFGFLQYLFIENAE